ncbi:MAG: hypothetical protein ACR2LM_14500 [Pyrinomonadaceae bacterium]
MGESRESIANTVMDIKEAVADEYESIKQNISDTFDWREQFRKHPVAWMVGALSVGYVVGNSISGAYSGTKSDDQLLPYLGNLGEKFTNELAKQGISIPALTGTILVPIVAGQLKEAFGIDLSGLQRELLTVSEPKGKKAKPRSKKSATKLKAVSKAKPRRVRTG